MNIINKILIWLLLVSFPVLLIASNIRILSNQICIYEYSINKYDIAEVTGINNAELKRVYQHWIDYYNCRHDSPQINVTKADGESFNLLSEKEIIHLQDVRELLQLDFKVQIINFIIVLLISILSVILAREWKLIPRALFGGSVFLIILLLGLGLFAIINFDRLLILFHQISFTNQFWILDPNRDYLIMMYPEGFFYDISLFGFALVILESAILAGICFYILRCQKDKSKQL